MANNDDKLNYAEKACIAFNEIMSGSKKGVLENMNRANKGELFVLQFLSMNDSAVMPSELSNALQSSTARISALLRSLEKKGQIRRDIDEKNRRNIRVTITNEGKIRAKAEMDKMAKHITHVFFEMGETDANEFIRLAKLFFELLQKNNPCQCEDE